jgi:hypothetical protein
MDRACSLDALRGLRTAPALTPEQARALEADLEIALGRCTWFTMGVMAPSAPGALQALRALEQRWGWPPLTSNQDGASPAGANLDGANLDGQGAVSSEAAGVFLKGNQSTGLYAIRTEAGLGEGILISGHNPEAPEAENTWGPFPLDFFG